MLNNPHRCVIDAAGYYIDFALLVEQPNGEIAPVAYELKPSEALIEALPPCDMIKPRWAGTGWEETATLEEIEEAKPEVLPHMPSIEERLALLEALELERILSEG